LQRRWKLWGKAISNFKRAANASVALNDIAKSVDAITEMNMQIATVVAQQSTVSDDITRSINSIRDTTDQNAHSAEENFRSATSVTELSRALSDLAGQFWGKRR
jgi:methyl-accepting chemotaxis protein